jgi:3-phenylpropionate/cinnamic acid dioxygenase small subunit
MTLDHDEVSARLDIMNLIARIAHLADEGEVNEYLDCFTANGAWVLNSAQGLDLEPQIRRGRADLAQGVLERRESNLQGPGSHTKHDVSSISVAVVGDSATATTYFRYYRKTDSVPELVAMGRYDDEFVRTGEGWRLTIRSISRN